MCRVMGGRLGGLLFFHFLVGGQDSEIVGAAILPFTVGRHKVGIQIAIAGIALDVVEELSQAPPFMISTMPTMRFVNW